MGVPMRTTEQKSPFTVHLNTKNRVVNVGFFLRLFAEHRIQTEEKATNGTKQKYIKRKVFYYDLHF